MLPSLLRQLRAHLEAIELQHRLRSCQCVDGRSRTDIVSEGLPLTSFCSNDYLGLACHPVVREAASEALRRSGIGAGASRLLGGTFPEHLELEGALAHLVRSESALLFPSGYQANLAAITALADSSDLIVADRAVHASLIDASRLSRAKLALYPHLDLTRARRLLEAFGSKARRRFLVTESLFSMDGDIAPLPELAALADAFDAALVVDEAHALGIFGPQGGGLCAHFGVQPDILIGTLGKAFGASGAFVGGDSTLCAYLVNHARPFLFTTAVPLPVAAAARAAVAVAVSQEGEELRKKLHANTVQLRRVLRLSPDSAPSPILPIVLGSDELALEAARDLRAAGLLAPAIRPPTVQPGTSRLRITLSAPHSEADINRLADALLPILQRRTPGLPVGRSREPTPSPEPPPFTRRGITIVGTDTGVGKSTVAAALLHLLTRRGLRPVPFKPVETGADPKPRDALRLLQAAQRSDIPLELVCPFAFLSPLAPRAAAAQAGANLTLPVLLAAAADAARHGDPIVVETAGGLLSPYGDHITSADLAAALGLPVLLVAKNALGTVSHTALAIAEIRRRRLPLAGIVLAQTDGSRRPDHALNAGLIRDLIGFPPLGIFPHVSKPDAASLAAALEASVDLEPILASLT